ncbi:MAG TPA: beta-ketoacyl-ACP synthase [Terricaulis sp.]|nr:beta-ketoacyl-ACP synthase [Terricaulis sp.]
MSAAPVFIHDFSVACALGDDAESVAENLFAPAPPLLRDRAKLSDGRETPVGRVQALGAPAHETRTNRIIAHAYQPLAPAIEAVRARYGAARVGVVLGGSVSGIGEGGDAARARLASQPWPAHFTLERQQLGDGARFLAELAGAEGPAYVVSTACTSGARALVSAARLLQANLCDVVISGGADALCELTLNGFAALEAISVKQNNPMSANRDGLNLGEGAGLFIVSREEGPFRLAGWGESADGHHMSAPDPEGAGAEAAMRGALAKAGLEADAIDFVHLHGTATPLNDAMESGVVARVLGLDTPCASTKPLTGHTLGAAGAVQAALCLLAMQRGQAPPHMWDGERDAELAHIRLAAPGERAPLKHILSASYAFGGNNAALLLAAS